MSFSAFIGIDDGYFPHPKKAGLTVLAGVLFEGMLPRRAAFELIEVDGLDGTEKAAKIAKKLLARLPGAKAVVFLDGVSVAGFNFIDPKELEEEVGAYAIAVFRAPLSLKKIEEALRKHFADCELRLRVYREAVLNTKACLTPRGRLHYFAPTLPPEEVLEAVRASQVYSPTPEPLRVADMLASEASKLLRELGVIS